MSRRRRSRNDRSPDKRARGRLLAAWEPPPGAGDPVGIIASTFTFDAGFFEEELLARFLSLECSLEDGQAWLVEREEKLSNTTVAVLVDRRHMSRSTSLAWDLLPVALPGRLCQHAKITFLVWEKRIRLIVCSANLTPQAYRRNLEVFAALDWTPDGGPPRPLAIDFLTFLRRIAERVPGTDQVGIRERLDQMSDAAERLLKEWDLPETWPRGATHVEPVLLDATDGPGVLDQMGAVWGRGAGPEEIWVTSPFWGHDDGGGSLLVEHLVQQMAKNGERTLHLAAPGTELSDEEGWLVEIPGEAPRAVDAHQRLTLEVHPVLERSDEEARPLHAKVQFWQRGPREVLLIGSSNATRAGLGLGPGMRNFEANLAYVNRGDRPTARWLASCVPGEKAIEHDFLQFTTRERADDEAGAPGLPRFFESATYTLLDDGTADLTIGYADKDEPGSWSLSVALADIRYDRKAHHAAERPSRSVHAIAADRPPPTLVQVTGTRDGQSFAGSLAVNARDARSRTRTDLWRDFSLEDLLEILISGGALHRAIMRIVRRGNGQVGPSGTRDLDPLRRYDSDQTLMRRMRRISRALEGLREKLARSVVSPAALDWRFDGPLGPTRFARLLVEHIDNEEERAFLLAEVALVVGRAAKTATGAGVSKRKILKRYHAAITEIRAHVPTTSATDLGQYIERSFTRALK